MSKYCYGIKNDVESFHDKDEPMEIEILVLPDVQDQPISKTKSRKTASNKTSSHSKRGKKYCN